MYENELGESEERYGTTFWNRTVFGLYCVTRKEEFVVLYWHFWRMVKIVFIYLFATDKKKMGLESR